MGARVQAELLEGRVNLRRTFDPCYGGAWTQNPGPSLLFNRVLAHKAVARSEIAKATEGLRFRGGPISTGAMKALTLIEEHCLLAYTISVGRGFH